MAPKTVPPRSGGIGSIPPSGNPKVPTPPVIQFDDDRKDQRKNKLVRNQRAKADAAKKGGFLSWLINLATKFGVLYLLVGAFWTCSSRPFAFDFNAKDDRAHCRGLAQARQQLTPIVTPYVQAAHAKVRPYTDPYVKVATPYAKTAWKTTRPYYRYAHKQGRQTYNRHIEPARKLALKRGKAYVDPHLKTVRQHYNKQIQPRLDSAQKAVRPYQDVYRRDVAPYLNEAYAQSLAFGSASYTTYVSHVHPVVVRSLRQVHAFYIGHVDPAMRRAYALYIRPQADKAFARIFAHKAKAVGSEALSSARDEAKHVRQEAKQAKDAKVAEAVHTATRAERDPTLVDRINKAKDQVTGGPLAAADPVASASQDASLEVEAKATKEELDAWEKNLGKLLEKEYAIVIERLGELRTRFAETLPERFNAMTEDVEVEIEGIFGRLTKTFNKLQTSNDDATEKPRIGQAAIDKQRSKLQRSRAKAVETIDGFYGDLQKDEYKAQRASVEEVDRYVVEAQKAYAQILKNAHFEQTRSDWQGWDDGLGVRKQLFDEELSGVRSGSKKVVKGVVGVDPGQEGDIQRQISKLNKQIEGLYDTALAELGVFGSTELARLGGKEAKSAAGKVLESVAESAQQLSADAQAVVQNAADALGNNDGNNVASILSSKASVASASASSLAREGAKSVGVKVQPETPQEYLEDAAEAVKAGFRDATKSAGEAASSVSSAIRSATRSAGLKGTPESAAEYAEAAVDYVSEGASSAASQASESASALGQSASSVLRQATRSMASVAGASVTPETPAEYFEAARDGAASLADSAVSAGQQVLGGIAVESVLSDASSALHSATRSAASAAGFKPTPETASEYLEFAQDQASSVADAAASAGQSVYAAASQRGQEAVSVASEAVDAAGSNVHAATRSLASAAGLKPTPETMSEYAERAAESFDSAASGASEAIEGYASDASSLLRSATRSAASLVGVVPTPESVSEYVAAAGDAAQSAASAVSSAVVGTGNVEGSLGKASSVAASVASSISSVASSGASQVSRSAVKAAGGTPEPEGVVEQLSNLADQVKSAASSAIEPNTARAKKINDEL